MTKGISSESEVNIIRRHLKKKTRDLLLFDLATTTGCKLKDALRLKTKHLAGCQIGDTIIENQNKFQENFQISMTKRLYGSFQSYCESYLPEPEDFLFKSRKGNEALTSSSASRLIRIWFKQTGIKDLAGYSSLIETWKKFYKPKKSLSESVNTGKSSKSSLTPVLPVTHQESVFRRLRDAILNGEILPGTRLKKEVLANLFQVSDTPVREALARLLSTGLVSRAEHKGFVVNKLTAEDLTEIVKIRVNLECMLAIQACKKITDIDLKKLKKLMAPDELVMTNPTDFYRANREFHKYLYKLANMPIALKMVETLWDMMSPYFSLLSGEIEKEHKNLSWKNHEFIIQGLEKGNPNIVSKSIKQDINGYASLIIIKIKNLDEPMI